MRRQRVRECDGLVARSRLRTGLAYLEVAELVLGEDDRAEFGNVAAGLAVLAGIAATDCICCARLGQHHRGPDHRGAVELLRTAVPDGPALAVQLTRLLTLKDQAHYGVVTMSSANARQAVQSARRLLKRAGEEAER